MGQGMLMEIVDTKGDLNMGYRDTERRKGTAASPDHATLGFLLAFSLILRYHGWFKEWSLFTPYHHELQRVCSIKKEINA